MISKASITYARIAPRKVRYVIDLIRKKGVPQAQGILNGSPRRAADIIRKLLDAAVDAAEKNSKVAPSDLFVSKVLADGGPMMKRFRAMSMGRAGVIRKRTSHIELELSLTNKAVLNAAKAQVQAEPRSKKSADRKSEPKAEKKTAAAKPGKKKLAGAR